MTLAKRMSQFFAGRIGFPAVNYVLNRKDILGHARRLLATERQSPDALRDLQLQKLSSVLRHAHQSVPFYTWRFKEIGLAPGDIKTVEDLRRIPPLTRQEVVSNRIDLVDLRCRDSVIVADQAQQAGAPISFRRFRRRKLVRNTSSGSTGTPTVFYEDGTVTALNWAHELRLKQWFGLEPGAKEARMSAISSE